MLYDISMMENGYAYDIINIWDNNEKIALPALNVNICGL
jgi:hypothetical protein